MTEATTTPIPDALLTEYAQPHTISDIVLAFPARLGKLLPDYDLIPKEYQYGHTLGEKLTACWFYNGLVRLPATKPGISADAARRHISAVLASFEPKHEAKAAGSGLLATLWFEEVDMQDVLDASNMVAAARRK